MTTLYVDDIFEVLARDPSGQKFDKVSRLQCHSDLYQMDMMLDVNVDVYPVHVGDKLSVALAPTIATDNSATEPVFNAAMQSSRPTLMDDYEYVMFGRIFKYVNCAEATLNNRPKVEVTISFGGLLLQLSGEADNLKDLEVDDDIYLLIRKVQQKGGR